MLVRRRGEWVFTRGYGGRPMRNRRLVPLIQDWLTARGLL